MTNQCNHGMPAFSYCQKCCREITDVRYLDKKTDFIRAAHAMVLQHSIHETMLPAVESVADDFPNIPKPLLSALWIGINARDRKFSGYSDDEKKKFIREINKGQYPWDLDN